MNDGAMTISGEMPKWRKLVHWSAWRFMFLFFAGFAVWGARLFLLGSAAGRGKGGGLIMMLWFGFLAALSIGIATLVSPADDRGIYFRRKPPSIHDARKCRDSNASSIRDRASPGVARPRGAPGISAGLSRRRQSLCGVLARECDHLGRAVAVLHGILVEISPISYPCSGARKQLQ